MQLAYIRVSSADQNEARQIEAMEPYGIERFFTEKVSGKNADRPKLQELLAFAREGDTIHVHDLSRLARSTKDLLEIVEILQGKGVALVSNKECIDTNTPTGKLMLTMIGAIAEFERACILDRQREGIAIAKRQGKYRGGQPKKICTTDWEAAFRAYQRREITKQAFAARLGISRPTLNKLIYKQEHYLET